MIAWGALDHPDTAVAVAEWVAKRPGERRDRLVQRQVRVDQSAVGEQLGAGTHSREQRADEHLAAGRLGDIDVGELYSPGTDEGHRLPVHAPPTAAPTVAMSFGEVILLTREHTVGRLEDADDGRRARGRPRCVADALRGVRRP